MDEIDNQVRPISFQVIPEDSEISDRSKRSNGSSNRDDNNLIQTNHGVDKLQPNFSFEYTYPAVTFDRVCFSIDRSQQQANFLDECLCKLGQCVGRDRLEQRKVEILKSINLNVPYGSIFGLLGPSSCGKTTLLRCLVGLLKQNSGSIRLFGHNTETTDDTGNITGCCKRSGKSRGKRSRKCKVPGSNIGYMPQDLGLYEDFSIRQLLTMFGQYMGMNSKLIETRIQFMAQFLDLPGVDREVQSLSGGQKRRVSFAIACLHMPPLIILDEPTVGVDPLLRQSIWKYLRRLADEENKTIIITTHYIEEAAQADQVAFMRAGEILIQDSPIKIMESNGCKSLEEAFLKICNNVQQDPTSGKELSQSQRYKLYPQPRFNWHDKLASTDSEANQRRGIDDSMSVDQLKAKVVDKFNDHQLNAQTAQHYSAKTNATNNRLSMMPSDLETILKQSTAMDLKYLNENSSSKQQQLCASQTIFERQKKIKSCRGTKLMVNGSADNEQIKHREDSFDKVKPDKSLNRRLEKSFILAWALLYKNYRRNVNSLPLLAFQFMLPIIQMISFSLCVGGRPTNIGLGLVNLDSPIQLTDGNLLLTAPTDNITLDAYDTDYGPLTNDDLLSARYLSFIDHSMLSVKHYGSLREALEDVRRAKLWAAMEIGENFTTTILKRFDLDNFYQLEPGTIEQSAIKLYPDRSNKVLDMICHRSLVNSYRKFLQNVFDHFKRLPIEVKEPVFDIKPNLISNSIDGYTESIAAGLLASLTYIMAAGLTTFIMVVERSSGVLERTFTSGINPVAYLLAHAAFRSVVMMLQIAVVMFLTFYLLQQPLVGSIGLAYLMLMTLNLTGIAYGLLISSIVTDQNGAALTIVSSLVVKITMSGILWPFEAIPRWLRTICYIQPLTMPVQALKTITLKGSGLEDRTVYLGFVVSLTWLTIFLTISARRFKFYQH